MARYESLLELYQAQNAVQIAQSQGAAQYAPEIFSRANDQLQRAQQLEAQHADRSQVISTARQASETAEDARSLALERKREAELAQARDEAASERRKRTEAEAAAQSAQAEASAEHQTVEAERTALQQAEATARAAAAAPPPSPEPAAAPATDIDQNQENREKAGLRASLLAELNGAMGASDTPRGLVVTLGDGDFRGASLNPEIAARLSRLASILASHPGLAIEVEGNTDSAGAEAEDIARERADVVCAALIRNGLRPDSVGARGLGNRRPIASNATSASREQNRRVEIVISGSAIGSLPNWDKPYSLNLR
jgi:outer membrane protein OmpA-like peptidoglycan-associated protein